MSELLQFLIAGMTVGAIYSVVALGFTMIYNVSGVVNFAQGEFVMLGAMLSVAGITIGIPFPELRCLPWLSLPSAHPY